MREGKRHREEMQRREGVSCEHEGLTKGDTETEPGPEMRPLLRRLARASNFTTMMCYQPMIRTPVAGAAILSS